MSKQETLDFFESFPYEIGSYREKIDMYSIKYGTGSIYQKGTEILIDINTLYMRFGFFPKHFNFTKRLLIAITKRIQSNFLFISKQKIMRSIRGDEWIEYQFKLKKIEDINILIDLLDRYFTLGLLSK